MTDLSTMIAAKSDQLNADDLLGGPRDIEITKVRGCSEPEQPVAIHFTGDDGKPWKPCKTMRRVLVAAWGPKGEDYVGRRLRLYRDDTVKFGGIQVGGIRVSHMSHLQGDMAVPVNVTRGKKAAYSVKVLKALGAQQRAGATAARAPDLSLDEEPAPAPLDAEGWDTKAYAQGQRDNADRIEDEATLRAWWAELGETEDFKRLLELDEGEALATKAHVIKRLKALKGGA